MEVAQVNRPVGLLTWVPVMLLVVHCVNSSKGWHKWELTENQPRV